MTSSGSSKKAFGADPTVFLVPSQVKRKLQSAIKLITVFYVSARFTILQLYN
jgi:hypothetical protein